MHHLIVYVPVTHADVVRKALADGGAGKMGNYDSCSFSSRGIGRFRPLKGSNPHVGSIDRLEEAEEERIDVVIGKDVDLAALLKKVRAAHPYEEPAIQLVRLVEENSL
jgi:hypothetical protein